MGYRDARRPIVIVQHKADHCSASFLFNSEPPPAYGYEQSTLRTQLTYPAKLRKDIFEPPPALFGTGQQWIIAIASYQSTWHGADIIDAVRSEPAPHLRQPVPMLFGVMILIANPCPASLRLFPPFRQNRVGRHPTATACQRCDTPQPMRQTRIAIVKAEYDEPAWLGQPRDRRKGRAGIRRMVQNARAIDDVECLGAKARMMHVCLHETDPFDPQSIRRRSSQRKRRATDVCRDHHAIAAREIETHLAGTASYLSDTRVIGDRRVEHPDEGTALGADPQPLDTVSRRIAGKRRFAIKFAHSLGPRIRRKTQVRDPIDCLISRSASPAAQRLVQRPPAARASDQGQRARVHR